MYSTYAVIGQLDPAKETEITSVTNKIWIK